MVSSPPVVIVTTTNSAPCKAARRSVVPSTVKPASACCMIFRPSRVRSSRATGSMSCSTTVPVRTSFLEAMSLSTVGPQL